MKVSQFLQLVSLSVTFDRFRASGEQTWMDRKARMGACSRGVQGFHGRLGTSVSRVSGNLLETAIYSRLC